ncbi:hypothetical protein GS393_05947 [Pseudomonas savastanoi pv. phaseolicola]|nr:hypothetical protein [Pseudomonas savastanoi pv. phaseolicola]
MNWKAASDKGALNNSNVMNDVDLLAALGARADLHNRCLYSGASKRAALQICNFSIR